MEITAVDMWYEDSDLHVIDEDGKEWVFSQASITNYTSSILDSEGKSLVVNENVSFECLENVNEEIFNPIG